MNPDQSDLGPYCLQYRVPKYKTSLLSYRDYLESGKFQCVMGIYYFFETANSKGSDQTAKMLSGLLLAPD